jgi:hypothetical protein
MRAIPIHFAKKRVSVNLEIVWSNSNSEGFIAIAHYQQKKLRKNQEALVVTKNRGT